MAKLTANSGNPDQMLYSVVSNSGDPDQMPHYVASDLGLHCLPI